MRGVELYTTLTKFTSTLSWCKSSRGILIWSHALATLNGALPNRSAKLTSTCLVVFQEVMNNFQMAILNCHDEGCFPISNNQVNIQIIILQELTNNLLSVHILAGLDHLVWLACSVSACAYFTMTAVPTNYKYTISYRLLHRRLLWCSQLWYSIRNLDPTFDPSLYCTAKFVLYCCTAGRNLDPTFDPSLYCTTVLYCTVLYCTVLDCTAGHHYNILPCDPRTLAIECRTLWAEYFTDSAHNVPCLYLISSAALLPVSDDHKGTSSTEYRYVNRWQTFPLNWGTLSLLVSLVYHIVCPLIPSDSNNEEGAWLLSRA